MTFEYNPTHNKVRITHGIRIKSAFYETKFLINCPTILIISSNKLNLSLERSVSWRANGFSNKQAKNNKIDRWNLKTINRSGNTQIHFVLN